MTQSFALRLAPAFFASFAAFVPAKGDAQNYGIDDIVSVNILPGWRAPDGTRMTGVRIQLAPGWKTYWRTPGDGGIPPIFDLEASENLTDYTPLLPRPEVFDDDGLRSIGYTDEVVFPLALTPTETNAPIVVEGALHIGVCEEICMPVEVHLRAELSGPGQSSALIQKALQDQPEVLSGKIACDFVPTEEGLRLKTSVTAPHQQGEVAVIELANPTLWVSHAISIRHEDKLTSEVDIYAASSGPIPIDRSQVRVTILSDAKAYEVLGCG